MFEFSSSTIRPPTRLPTSGAELAAADTRVEFRRHDSNRGHIATYNEGLEWVSGDYTLLLSADDLLTPGALDRATALLDAHRNLGFVYGRVITFHSDDGPSLPQCRSGRDGWSIVPGQDWLQSICAEGDNFVVSPEIVVRTELLRKLGGYRADLPHTADMELWMRLAAHSAVGFLESEQAYYRLHGTNMSEHYNARHEKQYRRPKRVDYMQRKAAYDALFEGQGDHLAEKEQLRRLATKGLAWNAFWTGHKAFERGDAADCDEQLGIAQSFLPEIVDSREWARLGWKRRMGPRAWSLAKILVQAIRRGHIQPARPTQFATLST